MGLGFRIAAEMVAAIGLGVAIGLFLDSELGTKPWMLILFLLLGAGGAFMNIMRTANEYERQAKERKAAEAGKPADSAGNIDDGDLK
jgi:ATP synthase protein I|tara:strand:+ start:2599 stop:2859 length:261 start_codon:yes stop_codon:yes gene_type:complete